MQREAIRWCVEVAGQRVHGTTRKRPLVIFENEEKPKLNVGGVVYVSLNHGSQIAGLGIGIMSGSAQRPMTQDALSPTGK